MSRWYRAYEGTVTDAKLAEAAAVADVSRAVSIAAWHALLESAATVNNCGSFTVTPRRVSIILCEPTPAVEALFAAYAEIGLIEDGVILAWKKRQHASDNSAERTREYRERKRQKTAECDGGDGAVTSPNKETETEAEEESVSNETLVGNTDDETDLKLTVEHLEEAWNAGPVPRGAIECRRMKGKRRQRAVSFLRRYSVEDITEAIGAVMQSDFLCGRTKEGFRADITFLFSDQHMDRLLEGFYGR